MEAQLHTQYMKLTVRINNYETKEGTVCTCSALYMSGHKVPARPMLHVCEKYMICVGKKSVSNCAL